MEAFDLRSRSRPSTAGGNNDSVILYDSANRAVLAALQRLFLYWNVPNKIVKREIAVIGYSEDVYEPDAHKDICKPLHCLFCAQRERGESDC